MLFKEVVKVHFLSDEEEQQIEDEVNSYLSLI
jgi:hypothetical protein